MQAVVEDEGADAVMDVGDSAHDKVLVEGEEAGVYDAILAERGDDRDGRQHRDLLAQVLEDGVGLRHDVVDGGGAKVRDVADLQMASTFPWSSQASSATAFRACSGLLPMPMKRS